MNVPSLATIRPHLPPKCEEWVNSILAGETTEDFALRAGVKKSAHQYYSRVVAEWAGLAPNTSVREAVLRMRIRELEER